MNLAIYTSLLSAILFPMIGLLIILAVFIFAAFLDPEFIADFSFSLILNESIGFISDMWSKAYMIASIPGFLIGFIIWFSSIHRRGLFFIYISAVISGALSVGGAIMVYLWIIGLGAMKPLAWWLEWFVAFGIVAVPAALIAAWIIRRIFSCKFAMAASASL